MSSAELVSCVNWPVGCKGSAVHMLKVIFISRDEKIDGERKGVIRRFQCRVAVLPKGVGLWVRYWWVRAADEVLLTRHNSRSRALVAAHV